MNLRPGLVAPGTLLALAILSGACTPAQQAEAPPPGSAPPAADEKAGKDTLVIAVQSDADSFISVVSQSASDSAIFRNMFLALVGDEFECRTVTPPELAESFEHPDDGLSITFHLRKDIVWSDGVPVTAEDVAFTYDLVADPAVASPRFPYIENMKPDARPRIIDPHTVRFEFTHAYDRPSQIAHCGLEILPKHVLGSVPRGSLRETDFNKNPVVSGHFKVGKWEKDSVLELVPNEAYSGPEPAKLARVIFKVIPDYSTRLIELENGSVDMVESLQTMADIGRLAETRPEIGLHRRGWRFMDYIGWNLRHPLFADKAVRQALTIAINRQKLVDDLLTLPSGEAIGREAVSWITPELCDYRTEAIKPFPHDPALARQMLAAAGWTDTNGDGILDKNGKPFKFKLMTNVGNARRAKAVIIVQANLKDIGVEAQVEQIETNTFFERTRTKDFEAALSGWSAGLFVDPTDLWHSDTPEKKYEFNFCSFANARADELIELGMRTPKLEEQIPIWQELQQIIYDEQPYTFLYWRDEVVALHERFRDPNVDMLAYIHNLNEWWVPESKVKYKY